MFKFTLELIKTLVKSTKSLQPRILTKMADIVCGEKRTLDESADTDNKKTKLDQGEEKLVKKKVALLMMYSGAGYMGMQRNPGFHTVEEDLLKALKLAGCIPQEHYDTPQKMQFQRAARTDKGVSAAGQIVSLKMWSNVPHLVASINSHLPTQIRVIDIIRTTNNFNSKNSCSHRTYSYLLPTYAFTPLEECTYQKYRVPDGVIDRVNTILTTYVGTHNFHNFTSGKKPEEASARRYIMSMQCSQPLIRDDIEFAIITVKGQSFMLHQIRKMIGLMIAIVRGHASDDSIQQAYQYPKFDVPKAPGLGLMLEHVHYDQYNNKFGDDGIHQRLEWDPYMNQIEEFKQKFIYSDMILKEKEEQVTLTWLQTLFCHKFESLSAEEAIGSGTRTELFTAQSLVWRVVKAREASESEAKASEIEAKASENEAKARENEAKAIENEAKARENEAKAIKNEAKAIENEAKASNNEAKVSDNEANAIEKESLAGEIQVESIDQSEKVAGGIVDIENQNEMNETGSAAIDVTFSHKHNDAHSAESTCVVDNASFSSEADKTLSASAHGATTRT